MSVERGLRPTSPVHVHVKDDAPVHVHIKPGKSKHKRAKTQENEAVRRTRSRSPGQSRGGPWVPPPGRTTKGKKTLQWQGSSSKLEVHTADDGAPDTEDEEVAHAQMRQYERKIDSLMGEVGALKDEVELQRGLRSLELDAPRVSELDKSAAEMRAEVSRSMLEEEQDLLLRKLIETELDAQATVKQLHAMMDLIRSLRQDRRLSPADTAALVQRKQELLAQMAEFDCNNKSLRTLLRERHRQESGEGRASEQAAALLRRLTDSEAARQALAAEARERDRVCCELRMQLKAQTEEQLATASIKSSLETNRAHLQKQLKQKEADCNRMAVQIRTLESQLAQEKIEVEHVTGLLTAAKEKAERDREALKKATRAQKQRAARSEDALEGVNSQLLDKESACAELQNQLEQCRVRLETSSRERGQLSAEKSVLSSRVSDLEADLLRAEDTSRVQAEALQAQLQERASELSASRVENQRLKSSALSIEEKLSVAEREIGLLRGSVREYELLMEEHRSKAGRARSEADQLQYRLDEERRQASRQQQDQQREIERLRSVFQQKLQEFEPLPEMLKNAELQLHEATESADMASRKSSDHVRLINDLSTKVDQQASHMQQVSERSRLCGEENQALHSKMDALQRKLAQVEDQNHELSGALKQREAAAHDASSQLEEKSRENASLTRQLEAALSEARRQVDASREKSADRERGNQQRLLELESQLTRTRAELTQAKREKDESERRFNSRLYDLRDRLEQSHSTNRSMQNYVQFLKNSYSNVFGDAATAPPPAASASYAKF